MALAASETWMALEQCEKDRLIRDERSDALVRAVLVGDDRQGRTSGGRPLGGRAGTTLDVATTYNNIALVYKTQGKYEMALGQYEMALGQYAKCLAIEIKALGEDHPDVAFTYNMIGLVYNTQGKHEMALELYAKSLAIQIKTASKWAAFGRGEVDHA